MSVGRFMPLTLFRQRPRSLHDLSLTVRQEIIRRYCSSRPTGERKIRIGCASGFWGDTATSAPQLIHNGNIDFLVFDYLSEITMSLMTAAKHKSPDLGYAPDFIQAVMAPLLGDIKKKGIRVISNAGGINPHSCAAALKDVAKKSGVDLKVAVVTGDNVMSKKSDISETGVSDIDSGVPIPKTLVSMNAYLGATPISRALDLGAEVVITGRCVDSAVVLGPLMHTFGWAPDDYNLLAQGSLAGHLVECGAQATGGIFTDWHTVPDWDNIGFPIAECSSDGSFIITKPPKTGGLVSVPAVAEQLVYEIGDPKKYLLPDVTCDFSQVKLSQVHGEAVSVTGALGSEPTNQYKVSATYTDGYRVTAVCPTAGINAAEKGRRTAESILKRVRRMFKFLGLEDFTQTNVQMLGSEESYGPHSNSPNPREIVIWLAVQHQQKKALEIFSREIAPAGTGMCPGLTGIVGGRPRVSPVLRLFSFLYPKENVTIHVEMDDLKETVEIKEHAAAQSDNISQQEEPPIPTGLETGSCSYTLGQLAYARSGDKGNSANIGVIARHPSFVPYLREALTEEAIRNYFRHILEPGIDKQIQRFELPGIQAFNFLLKGALGGGGVASLRSDPQGKALGQMLLDFQLDGLPDLLSRLK
ncbi:uncharacterized protein LOC117102277 [Anneissia japonica]|uniref:uncharacterized protein LOC117102277 n=1 Tax=Anneissia japonica TaxID=1529436 RepID=UPI0014256103|nr:uncharacterized protein LOC117102277 [Anneissia japonica]